MACCSCINKLFLVVLNFIIFVVGVGVVALASVVINRSQEYGKLLFEGIFTLPIWILIIGIAVTLLGFFGCCGAMNENSCMLYTYATIVTVLFLAEVVIGILLALYPEKASKHIKDSVKSALDKYGGEDDSLTKAVDAVQHDYKCCGVESYEDWDDTEFGRVPQSCCKDHTACVVSNPDDVFQEGCFHAIYDGLQGITITLGITAIVLAVIQAVCICIACGLAKRKSQYV